jgi:hypothetical protein
MPRGHAQWRSCSLTLSLRPLQETFAMQWEVTPEARKKRPDRLSGRAPGH